MAGENPSDEVDLTWSIVQVYSGDVKQETIGISEFKSKCIAILKRVQDEKSTLIVTHRGKPVARIEPIEQRSAVLGGLKDFGSIRADLLSQDFSDDWEMES